MKAEHPEQIDWNIEDPVLFKRMVEDSRDGICITQHGNFRYANEAFCRMLGYSKEELAAINGADLLAPWNKERVMQQHYRRMEGRQEKDIDNITMIRKDGSYIDIEMSASAIRLEGNWASFISARDITERKRMQEALEKSEQKYRMLIENAQDGIIITQDGAFKLVNKAFCETVGYSENELLGMNFLQVVAEEDKERLMEYHQLRMSGSRHHMIYEAKGISKAGNIINFEINTTFIEFNDRPATFIILRDQTERKNLEATLKESERKYRELSDFLPQTIFELDPEGRLTYMNRAGREAYGFMESPIGQDASNGVIPEDKERLIENIRKAYSDNRPSIADEYTAQRVDGSTFPVIIYGSRMMDNDQFIGYRGLIIDISERKSMEEALRKSEERYRKLIQSLQEGLFVIQEEKFIFVNEAIVNILGYTVDEMLGRRFVDVIPPDRREEMQMMHRYRKQGQAGSWSYEYTLLHKDGVTRIPVILSTNLTEIDGKMAVVGTAKDITERIKAEEDLKLAHKRLAEINHKLEESITQRTKELTEANTQLLKAQKENLQSQFDVLKQQVNPHFLFNSLNVLTSLIRLEPDLAEKFTEHLAKVYRYVLENKDNELVKLSTELDFLDAYLFLLNIRFMDKLVVNIGIQEREKDALVIPLAMQLLIENAIKHNSMSKRSPLVIDIFVDEDCFLNVVNNLQEREAHMVSTGVGLKNIQNRYLLINNTAPVFEKTGNQFIARIPLICDK